MSGFDWDSQEDAPAFSWDDQEDVDKPQPIQSAVNHFIQGGTAGFSDEIVGLGEAAGRALGVDGAGSKGVLDMSLNPEGPTLDWETLRDAYRMARNKDRENLKAGDKYNPASSAVGQIAGMVASPINKVGKGLSLAKQGAVVGGTNSLGMSDAEDIGGMAIDTSIGTAGGLLLGKGIDKASPYIEKGVKSMSSGARSMAEKLAARALGAERGSIKKLGMDKVKSAGAQALDEGVLSPLANTDDLIARNTATQERGGKMMGDAYKAIDDAGASTFNPLNVATKVDENIGGFYRSPINRGETNQLENTLESILMRGEGSIPLREAQTLKQELGKVANWKNNITVTEKEKMAREAYRTVSEQIDNAVADGSQLIDKAGLAPTLAKGKELFGNAATAETLLGNKLAREQGNNLIGLGDKIVGGAALGYGGVTDDWQTAGGVMVAKKGLEKYGAQNSALLLNKVSQMLARSPQLAAAAAKNPNLLNALAKKLESRISPAMKAAGTEQKPFDQDALLEKTQGSKYAQVLQNASQRGGSAVGVANFVLQSRDPEYRKLTLGEGEEE